MQSLILVRQTSRLVVYVKANINSITHHVIDSSCKTKNSILPRFYLCVPYKKEKQEENADGNIRTWQIKFLASLVKFPNFIIT